MQKRLGAAAVLLALTVSACGGGSTAGSSVQNALPNAAPNALVGSMSKPAAVSFAQTQAGTNAVSNPGFETGSLTPWTSCGSVKKAAVSKLEAHSGTYSALIGTRVTPEINGTAAVCQTVVVPDGGQLSFWVYEGTTDSISYVDQEADVRSTSGTTLKQLYSEAATTNGWVLKSFDLSSYSGQSVQLYFGVKGNGYAKDYVYEFLDDVTLVPSGVTPSPTPSVGPTPTPSVGPTPTPSVGPTPTPSSAPFPCNNTQFLTDQSEFASGKISADQLVDICGSVTQVLPSKVTSSGNHGYFYVQMPSGYNIEIVSNLDAMAQASTDKPPSTWPWVAVGQYVYVQGRYYYDNSSSQGIDWTEDDTGSWPDLGWVAVCTSSGASCSKYW